MHIEDIRRVLASHEPEQVAADSEDHAAVAVVLREGARGSEVLLIERAIREGDPWSGHMAFPGGRREPSDDSSSDVATRETLEEVGLDLAPAEYLGHLDELRGNPRVNRKMVVSAHAYYVGDVPPFVLDPLEVQQTIWVPLAALHEEERWVEHSIPNWPDVRFPGVCVGEPGRHIVWGLTYRFLDRMFGLLGQPFPDRWGELTKFVDP